MNFWQEIGPSVPAKAVVRAQFNELFRIAKIGLECTGNGPGADLARAVQLLDKARIVVSPVEQDDG